jgi:hypothetical protein
MGINIFISRPTNIAEEFEKQFTHFGKFLKRAGFDPVRLGANNYTLDAPLIGVIDLMKTCQGAIILGYPQYELNAHVSKGGCIIPDIKDIKFTIPTPWNQIEATLAYKDRIPVLIIAHNGIMGGVFDHGVTGEYVLNLNLKKNEWYKDQAFQGVFSAWKNKIL